MAKLPSFLQGYRHPGPRHPMRLVEMTSWITLHKYIVEHREELTAERYAQLMMIELESDKPRLQILQRLKGAMEAPRRHDEWEELLKCL